MMSELCLRTMAERHESAAPPARNGHVSSRHREREDGTHVVRTFIGLGVRYRSLSEASSQLLDGDVVACVHPCPQVALHLGYMVRTVLQQCRGHHGDIAAGQENLGHVLGRVYAGAGGQ